MPTSDAVIAAIAPLVAVDPELLAAALCETVDDRADPLADRTLPEVMSGVARRAPGEEAALRELHAQLEDHDWRRTLEDVCSDGMHALTDALRREASGSPAPRSVEWDEGFGLYRRYHPTLERYEYAPEPDAARWETFVDGRWLHYDEALGDWTDGILPPLAATADAPEWDEGFELYRRYHPTLERYEYAPEPDAARWETFVDGRWLHYDESLGWSEGVLPLPTGGRALDAEAVVAEAPEAAEAVVADAVRSLLEDVPAARELAPGVLATLVNQVLTAKGAHA